MHYIYALVDPRRSELRYIGATCSKYRLSEHIKDCKRKNSPVNMWVREIIGSGYRPVQVILQKVTTEQDRHTAEMYWIGHFRELGCDLLNVTIGGPGSTKAFHAFKPKPSPIELRRKRSLAAVRSHAKRRARAQREGWDKY